MADQSEREGLQRRLKLLHKQLNDAEQLDEQTRQLMQAVTADIQQLLEEEPKDEGWALIKKRWHEAALDFESHHPRLAQTVDEITGLLASVGF